MDTKTCLKQLYNEQYDALPVLSQEEIVSLYESEGITSETFEEALERIQELTRIKKTELNFLTRNNPEDDLLNIFFDGEYLESIGIDELKKEINDLIKEREDISFLYQYDSESYFDKFEDDNIKDFISDLDMEIANKRKELESLQIKYDNEKSSKEHAIEELKKELDELEKELKYLQRSYKRFDYKIYMSTSGKMPYERKFPSYELRNKIVIGTIGLARYWARVYYHKSGNTIPFDDLFQVANEALISAAHYYIPSDRAKFTTYASKCIENKLKHEVYKKYKLKKRPYKPEQFFQKEKDRIKYIQMFLQCVKVSYKNKYSNNSDSLYVSLFNFKKKIQEYNREMRMRCETKRFLPSFSGIGNKDKLNVIVNRIIRIIHESKINNLITDEDRNLASMLANHQRCSNSMQDIYMLNYYLSCYFYKLDLIQKYLIAEKELILKNNGVTPSDMEILEEINRQIGLQNQLKYQYRKEGFFSKGMPRYKFYYDYGSEYLDKYNVDTFISSDDYECEGVSSKKKEYDDIASEFFRISNGLETISKIIDSIKNSNAKKVVLYFADDLFIIYDDWEEFDEYSEYLDCDIFSKEEALEKLRIIYETLSEVNEDEYVKMVLLERKNNINAILKEKNAPIIEENKRIAEQRDIYNLGPKYQKSLKETDIEEVKRNIELLFGNDSELLILLNANGRENRWYKHSYLSVEDEVLNNIFLEDYYYEVSQLPELEREVLLRYFDENGYHSAKAKEIGSELGITENQVYKAKARAIKKLSLSPKLISYCDE